MLAVHNSTPDGYIRTLCSNYENITPKDVWEKYKELKGVSPITGVPMVLEPNAEHRVSIHNLDNTDKGHSNWTLDLFELNVSQHYAIPCLRQAYTAVYETLNTIFEDGVDTAVDVAKFRANFNSTPTENGVTTGCGTPEYDRQLLKMHLPHIIGQVIAYHCQSDIKKERMERPPEFKKFKAKLKQKVVDLFTKQHGRCFYSGITMTIHNEWTRFSLERLDNTKAHFNEDGTIPDTTVLICRLFNVTAQMSRAKVLTYSLHERGTRCAKHTQ
jgi:hypothetical protein